MKLIQAPMNILTIPQGWYTAVAVSEDIDCSVGLPKLFNDTYQIQKRIPTDIEKGKSYVKGNTFVLVVKSGAYDQVDIQTLTDCVESMAEICVAEGVERLAIPKLCCGRNALAWRDVKKIIKEAFKSTNITVLVCG